MSVGLDDIIPLVSLGISAASFGVAMKTRADTARDSFADKQDILGIVMGLADQAYDSVMYRAFVLERRFDTAFAAHPRLRTPEADDVRETLRIIRSGSASPAAGRTWSTALIAATKPTAGNKRKLARMIAAEQVMANEYRENGYHKRLDFAEAYLAEQLAAIAPRAVL